MAHPKRKISRTRRNKRRTHHKLQPMQLRKCGLTSVHHPTHEAYEYEGGLYYRGRLLVAPVVEEKPITS